MSMLHSHSADTAEPVNTQTKLVAIVQTKRQSDEARNESKESMYKTAEAVTFASRGCYWVI